MDSRKQVGVVTGTEMTRVALCQQLEETIGDIVQIDSYALDEWTGGTITADVIVVSSKVLLDEPGFQIVSPKVPIIVARRIINYNYIDRLLVIPEGTDVLLVNDVKSTVYDSINSLEKLGVDHLNYIPHLPGEMQIRPVSIAITPGEIAYVPEWVEKVIDIGPRLLDLSTILEVLRFFELHDEVNLSEKYMKKIIQLSRELVKTNNETLFLNSHLKKVIDGVHDGILAINAQGIITAFNENLESILAISRETAIGRKIEDIIIDTDLLYFVINGDVEENMLFSTKHYEVVVNRFKIITDHSIVCTFKDTKKTIEIEKKLKQKMVSQGYVAKYKLNDIIGESAEIQEAKQIANKLAKTNLTVLIEGESGTGKELFASAIHSLSERRLGPYLAVNFSALPEDLVEAELFGYEEGSFTGAKKGGKVGLFEQANGGTIFLDEIGDISSKIQARLLRVLQEKEIMRIGGNKIIPIDVRIIAATNCNFVEMINSGKFRVDLYHRLKALYLRLPPLRERIGDLPHLIRHFMIANGKEYIQIDDDVLKQLQSYTWNGNIRELKNTIDYMLTVCDGTKIRNSDIPNHHFFEMTVPSDEQTVKEYGPSKQEKLKETLVDWETNGERAEYLFLLNEIYELNQRKELVGRKKLSELTEEHLSYRLTEQQIRYRLQYLEDLGFISKRKGRAGTKITPDGRELLMMDGERND
ncbi:sigma 54-interacting transcriptional regulator [Anaerobacillus isosaccharinicus]|uniref:Sigma 54-interacting transcriptional regulator n=1 Tax=Anaerobacillus isosaccharinicus TaxID=1532552 RepID=A0A1S2LI18_9BACI|nr:sigma 54-interacting transcriptional regulator [Anaerobacillus isosaccharinicus]MBA5586140.1 sigma 54-interacting transcriptional regulator [Anaerobacillus isosaccharinicus]QOY35593.1 sigma 54-interacting transcriptional regulator [Anaerobacillus isosaccharinicus]